MRFCGHVMLVTSLVLAAVLSADPGTCPRELFRIERSKNANVVLFETKPGKDVALDPDEPIVASWLLLATTGKRESISFFERLFAYGFEARLAPSGESCSLTLKALKDRTIRVTNRGDCRSAFAVIGGADAVLQKIFVQADERGPAPSVQYIELFGVDVATGEARYEKVLRGK
jgi:hypothetical protein